MLQGHAQLQLTSLSCPARLSCVSLDEPIGGVDPPPAYISPAPSYGQLPTRTPPSSSPPHPGYRCGARRGDFSRKTAASSGTPPSTPSAAKPARKRRRAFPGRCSNADQTHPARISCHEPHHVAHLRGILALTLACAPPKAACCKNESPLVAQPAGGIPSPSASSSVSLALCFAPLVLRRAFPRPSPQGRGATSP